MLTPQQTNFINALLTTPANLALVARAGCGKTHTILQAVSQYTALNPNAELVIAAYNTAIKDEIAGKLKAGGYNWRSVSAATAHSLGYSLLKFKFNNPKIDDKKVRGIVTALNVPEYLAPTVARLVGVAKQSGVDVFSDLPFDSVDTWVELGRHYAVLDDADPSDVEEIVRHAQQALEKSNLQPTVVDFDDMIYLPLVYNIYTKFTKDVVFVDEAQDLSRTRQALLRRFVKPATGRMVVVGDDRQAIYGFSGADAEALPHLIEDLNATVFPLTTTWRCAKAVVREANRLVPDLTAAPTAPEGVVRSAAELPTDLKLGDAILCRNNAPLVETAYKLLRTKIACKVEGREIGNGLKALALRWKVKTVDALLNRLSAYEDRETAKATAKGEDVKIEQIKDRVDCLRFIVQEVIASGKQNVADVVEFIDALFADGVANVVVLCSYHRSKGREWDRVMLLEHSARCPSRFAKQPHEKIQETNLAYVAITRAKTELVYVN